MICVEGIILKTSKSKHFDNAYFYWTFHSFYLQSPHKRISLKCELQLEIHVYNISGK